MYNSKAIFAILSLVLLSSLMISAQDAFAATAPTDTPTIQTNVGNNGINLAEATEGVVIRVNFGSSNMTSGDTLELLKNSASFTPSLIKTINGTDIDNTFVDFTINSGELDEGNNSIISSVQNGTSGTAYPSTPLSLAVDTIPPIPTVSMDDYFDSNDMFTAIVEFSEPVIGFQSRHVTSASDINTLPSVDLVANSDKSYIVLMWMIDQNVITDIDYSFSIAAGKVTDAAGNPNTISNTAIMRIDNIHPTVAFTSTLDTASGKSEITVQFSEELSSFNISNVTASPSGAEISDFVKSTTISNQYKFTLTPVSDADNIIEIAATDLAGNSLAGPTSHTVDNKKPTVTITPLTPLITNGDIQFILELEVPLRANEQTPYIYPSHVTSLDLDQDANTWFKYTLRYNNVVSGTVDGPVTITVPEGYITDAAGNRNAEKKLTFIYDITPPTPGTHITPVNGTILNPYGHPELKWNAADENDLADKPYKVEFSDNNFAEIIYPSQDLSETSFTKGSVLKEGTYHWRVQVTDKAGNTAPSDATSFTIDTTAPEVTITSEPRTNPDILQMEFTIIFSEPVKDFDPRTDITIGKGSLSDFTIFNSTTSVLEVTANNEGFVTVAVKADSLTDIAGNLFGGGTPIRANTDKIAPTVSITTPINPTRAHTIPVTVTFAEPVTNFNATHVTVSGGTLSNFAQTNDIGSIYTFFITPIDTRILVNVADNVTFDNADNGNKGNFLEIQYISKSGSDDNAHKTRPTFGLDHNTAKQLVDGGFTFNDKSFNITDNFWTPFDKQHIKVGDTNTFSATVYADKQLQIQEFLFGITEVGDAHNAELGVEIFYGYDGEIEDINVIQKSDVIDAETLKVSNSMVSCAADDTTEKCNLTTISMKFLEPLKDDVMALKAIDYKNRYIITYLNDGFDVTGDSLNPMVSTSIPGTEKYEGLLKVTQTNKYSNVWESEDGRTFESNEYGTFQWTNETHERLTDTGAIKNRLHSEFTVYRDAVTEKAIAELLELCPTCLDSYTDFDDSWTYELSEKLDRVDDPVLQQKLIDENKRAHEIMRYLLDPISYYK